MKRTEMTCLAAGLMTAWLSTSALAEQSPDFLQVSLDQLADIEVTSVSKKSEKASEAPAAIHVITQEDIRRSGATSIPETLRMVPGISVARAGTSQWAITARGFSDQFANKLLVLMDGRSVYSPIFSGVWWDEQDTPLEDIERIEVIRGPGATLWGANAVNGVINIITKHAKDTNGAMISAGGGTTEKMFGTMRYGAQLDEDTHLRVYGKYNEQDAHRNATDTADTNTEWNMGRGGFRLDTSVDNTDTLTLQADVYNGHERQEYLLPVPTAPFTNTTLDNQEIKGGNVLGRWAHTFNKYSEISLQAYFDYTQRDLAVADLTTYTYDVDFQHQWTLNPYNEVVWGFGYRYLQDYVDNTFYIDYTPNDFERELFSGFVQDKIRLLPDELYLTLGSKLEHNDFSGMEIQPSAKLSWLVDDSQTLWASVSRAVRSPSRASNDITNPVLHTGTAFVVREGDPNNDSEKLIAYELGYRIQPESNLAFDVTTFFNDYTDIITERQGAPGLVTTGPFAPYVAVPFVLTNNAKATAFGVELAANWNPTDWWKLAANYSWLEMDIQSSTAGFRVTEGKNPKQMAHLRSGFDLPYDVQFDQIVYYMDELNPTAAIHIPDYLRLDLRLGWEPIDGLDLSVVGQNLLDPQHPEYSPFLYNPVSQVGRTVYGKVTWRF